MKPITLVTAKRETLETLSGSSDSPQLDTEMLLEAVTGLSRTQQLLQSETLLSEKQHLELKTLRDRRLQGEPLAYVLGERGFWTLQLRVNPAVLIPRPETELVVERALRHLPVEIPTEAADLGTGSGAIALAIASERPLVHVVATDFSHAALEVALDNARRCDIRNVEFVQSNWFEHLPGRPYDLIASNPPYIAENDGDVQASVKEYEPHSALFSGVSGLEALIIIARTAPKFLKAGGWLVLEHGWQQASSVRHLLESTGFSSVASHADLAGHERVTEGQWL